MEKILASVKPVVESSKFVRISQAAINSFIETVRAEELIQAEFNPETIIESGSEEDNTALSIVYNAINFCYWGEPKWTVNINGEPLDGSAGMLRVLKQAFYQGYPLLDSSYLAGISRMDLERVLKGNVEIPLFDERLEMLRTLGRIVSYQFDGLFTNIIRKGNDNAQSIVDVLVSDFPTVFDDSDEYDGQKVYFYKRAQLVPAHLADLFRLGHSKSKITGIDKLTAFADYKVPQGMRRYGILGYSADLANRVDQKVEIHAGSDEEMEIRANTIWANELVTRSLKLKFPQATAGKVDGIFWFRGQIKLPDDKPYHRTRTIWY